MPCQVGGVKSELLFDGDQHACRVAAPDASMVEDSIQPYSPLLARRKGAGWTSVLKFAPVPDAL